MTNIKYGFTFRQLFALQFVGYIKTQRNDYDVFHYDFSRPNNVVNQATKHTVYTSLDNELLLTPVYHHGGVDYLRGHQLAHRLAEKVSQSENLGAAKIIPEPKEEPVEEIEEPLPSWASSLVPKGRIISGQQVLTKDGRVTGNGVIFQIDVRQQYDASGIWNTIFHIITDAGNIIRLTQRELFDQYHLGKFHMVEYPGDPNGTKLDYYED